VNSCGKLFHIDSKAVFSSAVLVGFGMCSIPVSHQHDNPMDWDMATWIYISEVILKSKSQLNYLFTLKNVHLSSNSYNFRTHPNIATKFAQYMAWILLCVRYKFGEKNLLQFQRHRIFPRGLLFWRALYSSWTEQRCNIYKIGLLLIFINAL